MTKERILSLFYDQIVKEASYGRVDCFLYLNLTFTTIINNEVITQNNIKSSNVKKLPTLIINNKEEFDKLLVDYVDEAISFYDESNFTIMNDEPDIKKREDYLIKYIICTLFANCPMSDFSNPNEFIKNRISMFHNKLIQTDEEIKLGHIGSIGATLHIKEEQSPIKSETPYRIVSYLEYDDGYNLALPSIYAAKTESAYYLYGIQGKKDKQEENYKYVKQIRKGFIAKYNGAPEHYLFTFLIFISLCNEGKIISPYLVERANGAILTYERKAKKYGEIENPDVIEHSATSLYLIHFKIYEKLLLYFTKLASCSTGLDVNSNSYMTDDKLFATLEADFISRVEACNILRNQCKELRQKQNTKKLNIVNN